MGRGSIHHTNAYEHVQCVAVMERKPVPMKAKKKEIEQITWNFKGSWLLHVRKWCGFCWGQFNWKRDWLWYQKEEIRIQPLEFVFLFLFLWRNHNSVLCLCCGRKSDSSMPYDVKLCLWNWPSTRWKICLSADLSKRYDVVLSKSSWLILIFPNNSRLWLL